MEEILTVNMNNPHDHPDRLLDAAPACYPNHAINPAKLNEGLEGQGIRLEKHLFDEMVFQLVKDDHVRVTYYDSTLTGAMPHIKSMQLTFQGILFRDQRGYQALRKREMVAAIDAEHNRKITLGLARAPYLESDGERLFLRSTVHPRQ